MERTSVVVQGVPVSAGPRALPDVACEKGRQVKPGGLSAELAESGEAAGDRSCSAWGCSPSGVFRPGVGQVRGAGWRVFADLMGLFHL